MELAEDRVQWQALVLAVLNLLVLLPERYFNCLVEHHVSACNISHNSFAVYGNIISYLDSPTCII
jgi:hypothetical protein